jgi:hypothetical protein
MAKTRKMAKPNRNPIVGNASFTITGSVVAGQVVGLMGATNGPTSWALSGSSYFGISKSGVITVTSLGVSPLNALTVDTNYSLTVQASNRWGTGTGMALVYRQSYMGPVVPPVSGAYPGQAGNPVGFAASPGWPGSFTGGTITGSNSIAAYAAAHGGLVTNGAVSGSGTLGDPYLIKYVSFDVGTSGSTCVSSDGSFSGSALQHVKFIGCRFGDSDPLTFIHVDCYSRGSDDITFSYCSFVPSPAVRTQPTFPGAWPSASVGTGVVFTAATQSPYAIPYIDGTFQAISIAAPHNGVGIVMDHCDIWGAGNIPIGIGVAGLAGSAGTLHDGPLTISDCWIHDNRNDVPQIWSGSQSYIVGELVASSNGLFVYSSLKNGLTIAPTGTSASNADWHEEGTNDHTDGILVSNEWNAHNVTIYHCTLASYANGNGPAFQPGSGSASNYAPANNWSAAASYIVLNNVTDTDAKQYQCILAVGPIGTHPSSDTTHWALMGDAAYYSISMTHCYFGGFGYQTQFATNMPNCHDLTFTDNIYATDVMWNFAPVKPSDNPATFGAINQQDQWVAASNNVWRRNTLKIYSGDNWSGLNAFNNQYIIPDNFDGGPNANFSVSDWNL